LLAAPAARAQQEAGPPPSKAPPQGQPPGEGQSAEPAEQALGELAEQRQAAGPMQVAVRLTKAIDRKLLDRLRGQTSDLDVELEPVETDALEPDIEGQLQTAQQLADEHTARVVVWFDATSVEHPIRVLVLDSDKDSVLERTVGQQSGKSSEPGSAVLEDAALIVRGALQAVVAGRTIGVEREELVARRLEQELEPKRTTAEPRVVQPTRQQGSFGSVGWRLWGDGESPAGHHAVAAHLGYMWSQWEFGIAGHFSIGRDLEAPQADIEMARHAALATFGRRWRPLRWLDVAVRAHAGVALYHHETTRAAEGLDPLPDGLNSKALVGAAVRTGVLGEAGASSVGVTLTVGVDVLPDAPVFGVRQGGQFTEIWPLWAAQPFAMLAFHVEPP
jgi:hypothetical protein